MKYHRSRLPVPAALQVNLAVLCLVAYSNLEPSHIAFLPALVSPITLKNNLLLFQAVHLFSVIKHLDGQYCSLHTPYTSAGCDHAGDVSGDGGAWNTGDSRPVFRLGKDNGKSPSQGYRGQGQEGQCYVDDRSTRGFRAAVRQALCKIQVE